MKILWQTQKDSYGMNLIKKLIFEAILLWVYDLYIVYKKKIMVILNYDIINTILTGVLKF